MNIPLNNMRNFYRVQCSGNGRIVAAGTFLSSCDCFWGWEGSDCGLPFAEPRSPKSAILYAMTNFPHSFFVTL